MSRRRRRADTARPTDHRCDLRGMGSVSFHCLLVRLACRTDVLDALGVYALWPSSTSSVMPVMKGTPGPAKKTTAAATSSDRPYEPRTVPAFTILPWLKTPTAAQTVL